MKRIAIQPLEAKAFAPFGTVIEAVNDAAAVSINAGTCLKFANLAYPDCARDGGRPTVHIYRAQPVNLPFLIAGMERHSKGSQAFFPLSTRPFLAIVASAGEFCANTVRAFKASGSQGVQFSPGTWHHFCLALEAPSEFLVIDRTADDVDCDEVVLAPSERLIVGPMAPTN